MNIRSVLIFFLAVVFFGIFSGSLAAGDLLDTVGIRLELGETAGGPGRVELRVIWDDAADEAVVGLLTPKGFVAPLWAGVAENGGTFKRSFGPVVSGQSTVLDFDFTGLATEDRVIVAVERRIGEITYQAVVSMGLEGAAVRMSEPRHYRVRPANSEDFGPSENSRRPVGEGRVSGDLAQSTMIVESIRPKVTATIFNEDATVRAIVDGPGNCADLGGAWPLTPSILFDSAPAGALATAITVHVTIAHNDMSQMHVGFTEDDYWWGNSGQGVYLWKLDSGVNLDQDFTRDKYNNDLPGIGEPVNGWYQLWIRDCVGGITGNLNYWSVQVTYDASADYDLLADNVDVSPTTAAPGDDIQVVWGGHITGTDSVAGGFDIRIYLSNDSNITTADTVLATINEAAASDPGDTFGDGTPGRTVTLPPGVSDGTKYIGIIVDYNDAVAESNESNNIAWDGITIDSTSSFDLVADSITPQAGSVAAGASVNVNWFGHLDAASSGDISGNFTVGFYLSQDATVTTADTLLDRATIVGPTSPGGSFGANGRSLLIPGGTVAGTRYLGIIVDDTGSVAETNENNNIVASAITVTGGGGGQPDLVPSACSVSPSTVEAGGQVTVNWTERNQGDADASTSITRVFFSPDQTWGGAGTDFKLGERNVGPYVAGSQQSLGLTGTIPVSTDGTWYVLVVMDAGNQVAESNETNNMCVATITVGSGGVPGTSDRWLVPAAASASGFGGSDWRTQMAITNSTNQSREATIYYVSDSSAWPGVLLSGPITVGARQSFYLDDLLATLRPTAGLLYVVFDAAGPVVTSRTYNLASDGSTFGQGIPGIPLLGGSAPNELILPMVHSGAGRFHTNVGLVQASAGAMTVEISIYTAGGSLLAAQQRTVIDGWDQINDIFDKFGVGAATIEGGWIKVRLISGSPDAWTCYASVVDKETGDPTYVAGVEAE